MWPYINQEDLCTPRMLLLLLNARGRTTPDAFAFTDISASYLGHVTGALQPAFMCGYVMMLSGTGGSTTYGELIALWDLPEGLGWMNSGTGFGPAEGLTILEIQDRLWAFLVDCCKQILHDIPDGMLLDPKYPPQLQPPSIAEYKTANASLAILIAEMPYQTPATLDFARLEALLETKLVEAKDHAWALREDPGYFDESLIQFREHGSGAIPDSKGRTYRDWKHSQQHEFWSYVFGNLISTAYMSIAFWTDLHEQAVRLRSLQYKHASRISIGSDLPEEYLDALMYFEYYLEQTIKCPLTIFREALPASPEMRRFYGRDPHTSDNKTVRVYRKPLVPQEKVRDQLLWLIAVIQHVDSHNSIHIRTVVDEIERLVQHEEKAKALLSSFITKAFSELSLLTECLRQVSNYQPWAQTFKHRADKKRSIMEAFSKHTDHEKVFLLAWEFTPVSTLGNPEAGKFYYPADKHATEANTKAMIRAEKNLDLFWEAVDHHTIKQSGTKLEHTAIGRFLAEPRTLHRTPGWVETKKDTRAPVAFNKAEVAMKPMSSIYLDYMQQTNKNADIIMAAQKRPKEKTRGVPRSPKAPVRLEKEPTPPPETQEQSTITVDKKAYKVFSTLFHDPASSSQPGEIPWLHFCHAMRSAGFNAEKLYGSVWSFQPVSPGGQSGINFHEPHPSGKLPFREARRYGRRLGRRYGWQMGTFELAV